MEGVILAHGVVAAGAVTDSALFYAVVSAVLSGGGVYALVAFRKAGPEIEAISVGTMKDVIKELRTELGRQRQEFDDKMTAMSAENERLRHLNEELTGCVQELQEVIAANGA